MDLSSIKTEYLKSLKSSDTEEHIDLCFYRPIGFMWAKLFAKIGVSPNVVTLASIFIGVFAGICIYPNNLKYNILGILLLILANSFDSADGQLARLTNNYSRIGRILDGLAGDLWFLSIYIHLSALYEYYTKPIYNLDSWNICRGLPCKSSICC
jgi:hypothetical protein